MKRRRSLWLPAALLLFLLAAALMWLGQPPAEPESPAAEVIFPRRMERASQARAEARRTLPEQPPTAKDQPRRPRDPLLAALPTGANKTAVVLEANAIRNSPLGELLLECMGPRNQRGLDEVRNNLGIDVLEDLDRVAITPEGIVVSGHFAKARWDEALPDALRSSHGEQGRLFERPGGRVMLPDGGSRDEPPLAFGVWNDSVLTMGTPEEVRQSLDRLEGRGEPGEAPLDESQAYGELYGVLGVAQLLELFDGAQDQALRDQLSRAASSVELHADATSDVGVVARFHGEDPGALEDLGKTMGGLLAAARIKALAEGERETARLLEMASVQPRDGSFNLELALPRAFLEEQKEVCRERNARREEARKENERLRAEEARNGEDAFVADPADGAQEGSP